MSDVPSNNSNRIQSTTALRRTQSATPTFVAASASCNDPAKCFPAVAPADETWAWAGLQLLSLAILILQVKSRVGEKVRHARYCSGCFPVLEIHQTSDS